MVKAVGGELELLLQAATFSAVRHRNQRRKGGDASPYINHPLDVAYTLAHIGGVTDATTLAAAILHDTIEDTATTGEELEMIFGRKVRLLVEEVTDDKTLEKTERKRLQIEHAPNMSPAAKLIKLGDKISNIQEVIENPPSNWARQRRLEYIEWAEWVVAGCRGANESLERHCEELLREARRALAREA